MMKSRANCGPPFAIDAGCASGKQKDKPKHKKKNRKWNYFYMNNIRQIERVENEEGAGFGCFFC